MLKEFKTYLAVGVVVGGAFSTIVTSLVDDIIMPLIGMIIGGIDFSSLSIKVGKAQIMYGNFIQNIVNFLIIAFCIFLMVKFMNKLTKKMEDKMKKAVKKEKDIEEQKKAENILLLEEIRDLLKENKKSSKVK